LTAIPFYSYYFGSIFYMPSQFSRTETFLCQRDIPEGLKFHRVPNIDSQPRNIRFNIAGRNKLKDIAVVLSFIAHNFIKG
jgi:hypothetical protein